MKLVLRGATVVDGTGAAGYPADVAVADGRIHRVFFHGDAGRLRYLGPRRGPV